jgi:hypothetical protein
MDKRWVLKEQGEDAVVQHLAKVLNIDYNWLIYLFREVLPPLKKPDLFSVRPLMSFTIRF